MDLMAIVLAAGQGKRMKSHLYKVLHPLCGKPMVEHVVATLEKLGASRTVVVVGHGADAVRAHLGERVQYALQEQQLGTGHAALQAAPLLEQEEGMTVVLYGDTPLVTEHTLDHLARKHLESKAAATILTAVFENPEGYGRMIRGASGTVEAIVEQKDCTPEQAAVKEINSGIYCFDNQKLFDALRQVTNDNAQQEYYLTDVIGILRDAGEKIEVYTTEDGDEAIGINDRVFLAEAERIMRKRINQEHMVNGVAFIDPEATYIDADVTIGADTTIYPGSKITGATRIGGGCTIGPNADITDSIIEDDASVTHSVLIQTHAGPKTTIGPFAYLRPGTVLGAQVKVGHFVELKNAEIGEGSKVPHLSYIGDAKVGTDVNIGCGAITANYDGINKHRSIIEDNAFIGSNVNLVSPVTIGKGAYVATGSTITNDVGENDMAIARERQVNKAGYAEKLRNRLKQKSNDNQS